jgi:hypothetical protein
MASYHAKYDPTYDHIISWIEGCNYGLYKDTVVQHCLVFLKQFSGFTCSRKIVQFGMTPHIYLLWLNGTVPIKYESKDFNIPINVVLPENFPHSGPKVLIGFPLDEKSAADNPLVKNGNQVMNNYIHKWKGNDVQFNLGGLWQNLSKSFSIYPPIGKPGGGISKTDVIYIENDDSRQKPKNLVKKEYVVDSNPPQVPDQFITLNPKELPKTDAELIALATKNERNDLMKKLIKKLKPKISTLGSSVDGLEDSENKPNLIKQSMKFLEDNGVKLKKQALIIQNEKTEMEENIIKMKEFIAKNTGTDVNEVSLFPFISDYRTT